MSNPPDPHTLIAAVIGALEHEIEPAVADEYAASLCRTAAQMLRQLDVRLRDELPALVRESADLRDVLRELGEQVPDSPAPRWPAIDEARADVTALEARLAELVAAELDENSPVRVAARAFVTRQLRGRLSWERDAYTGPRR
ncbi:hypothetical protein [Nocardia alni]|uniref:hypothetical protein n=1 Tax=Nocardia alni TaxID=2815723 RepID=UPI001C23C86C|nr:hypothetical protein [Nocardia alni]